MSKSPIKKSSFKMVDKKMSKSAIKKARCNKWRQIKSGLKKVEKKDV